MEADDEAFPCVLAEARGTDDCRLWTEQAGAGDPLVLCHGGPGLWDYFDVAGLLSGLARTVRNSRARTQWWSA